MNDDIKINCQHCEGPIEFPITMIGENTACPHCNQQITLAAPEDVDRWFYYVGPKSIGPCNTEQIKKLLVSKIISPATHIMRTGAIERQRINEVSEFAEFIPDRNASTPQVMPFTKMSRNRLVACACAVVLMLGIAGWTWRGHQSMVQRLEQERLASKVQRLEQERLAAIARQEQTDRERKAGADREARQERQAQEDAKEAAKTQAALLEARDSDARSIENCLRATTVPGMGTVLLQAANTRLGSNDVYSIPSPLIGDPRQISETIRYVEDKICEQNAWNKTEIGCIGKSDLWVYRKFVQDQLYHVYELTQVKIFLLRDLDPTSGQIITHTDQNTGFQSYSLQFKVTNNKKRCVSISSGSSAQSIVDIQCRDEDEAKRVGKALAVLIVAYGGKGELFNSSDSF